MLRSMKFRLFVLSLISAVVAEAASAGLIEIRLSGSAALGFPNATPAPFTAAIRFDTAVAMENATAEAGRARFESVYVTALPSYVPPEKNIVLAAHNPELAQTVWLRASAEPSHPSDRGLYLLPALGASRVTISLGDGLEEDRLDIQISGGHSAYDQFGLSVSVVVDGESLWPGAGANFQSLEDFVALIGADVSVVSGSGHANEGRASPLNAWTLSIDRISIVAVADTETNGIVILLCGMLLPLARRRLEN